MRDCLCGTLCFGLSLSRDLHTCTGTVAAWCSRGCYHALLGVIKGESLGASPQLAASSLTGQYQPILLTGLRACWQRSAQTLSFLFAKLPLPSLPFFIISSLLLLLLWTHHTCIQSEFPRCTYSSQGYNHFIVQKFLWHLWAFCGWPCHSLSAILWTQEFLHRLRKIGMHYWNTSAKKPLHYILKIFPWKGSIGSWVKDLPVTYFQNKFWLLNPLIFIPSQNTLRISLIHALYTTVNFLRVNGEGMKPPDPVLQLCELCNSLDLIVVWEIYYSYGGGT